MRCLKLIPLLLIVALIPSVSAEVNITYTQATSNATPLLLVLFIAAVGISLLLLSVLFHKCPAIVAIVSPFPLFVSAWQFLSIDNVSGYGVVGAIVYESHTWYTMYPEAIIMFVLFAISVLNVYRVVMQINPKEDDDE